VRSAQRVAFVSFLWAAAVAAAKLAVAVRIGSVALLGDGLHSAMDMVATAMTLGAVRWASMPPDREHPYGHGRAENLAALGEAVLMVFMAAFVALEAVHRLRAGTVIDVRSYVLVVVVAAIGIDASRAAALRRAARRYSSPALQADAMNFTADIAESLAVLVGLGAARLGFAAGDPLAGLVVAIGMVAMAVRIGRSAFQVLMDRQVPALAERLSSAAAVVPGVVGVEDLRVRQLGPDVHADVTVTVPRTSTVERSHAITEAVEEAVASAVPGTSATVHVEPSSEGEDVVARTFAAANRIGMADQVHNVLAIRHPEGLWLMLHAKVAPDTPLARAHDVTEALERELRNEIPGLARVEIHIEPLEPRSLGGSVVSAHHERLMSDVRRIAETHLPITRCHEVAVSEADDGLHLVLHCEAPPDTPIARIHDASLATENEIHRNHEDVRTVTIHFEPETSSGPVRS
jgi:cation diffusion facilitator family transporter